MHIDDDQDKWVPFKTLGDLLEIGTVKRFSMAEGFSHFALSDGLLMQIVDDGYKWFVVGIIEYPELVDLPKWEGGKYRNET
jgi:hypothetical protein